MQSPNRVPLNIWRHEPTDGTYIRRIITEFTKPGNLLIDPIAGNGFTLVEAASLGRRCVAIGGDPHKAKVAQANLNQDSSIRGLAEIRHGDARRLPAVVADLAGQIDAAVIAPQRASTTDKQVFAGCYAVLRPGGLLITRTQNTHSGGRLINRAGATVRSARAAGFTYTQHIIALHGAIVDSNLVPGPCFRKLSQTRCPQDVGRRVHLVAHDDICFFVKPKGAPA